MKNTFLLTMQYNEGFLLPLFLAHYGQYFRPDQIHVIDHGSDANLVPAGCNRIFVPRARPFSEQSRNTLVKSICAGLLEYYDSGVYADCDELIDLDGVDPGDATGPAVRYVAGFEVFRAKTAQGIRLLGRLASHSCKPLIFSKTPDWSLGFHGCSHPPPPALTTPMVHLKYLFPAESADKANARADIHRGMDTAEQQSGIAHHWARGQGAVRDFYDRLRETLPPTPPYPEFSGVGSEGMFGMKDGRYIPVDDSRIDVFRDLTRRFRHVLAVDVPEPPQERSAKA